MILILKPNIWGPSWPVQSVPITTNVVSSNPLTRGVLDATLCEKVCQWLATGLWFSTGTPVSSTNKTYHHVITEILWKVALNTITYFAFLQYLINISTMITPRSSPMTRPIIHSLSVDESVWVEHWELVSA